MEEGIAGMVRFVRKAAPTSVRQCAAGLAPRVDGGGVSAGSETTAHPPTIRKENL